MGLNKKDRRISIWIGIIIGVTLSSMLFRYAIKDKNERSLLRPGSYESNITAVEGLPFPPIPDRIREAIPSGLVLYHESNHSISGNSSNNEIDCWIIESAGALRSERLFLLAEVKKGGEATFFRASELYITAKDGIDEATLSEQLPQENFRILGQNERTLEFILQVKDFSPAKLRAYLRDLPSQFKIIANIRLYPWIPEASGI